MSDPINDAKARPEARRGATYGLGDHGDYVDFVLSKEEVKELATILTHGFIQDWADKLRTVGEHERAETLWQLSDHIVDKYQQNQEFDRRCDGE